MLSTPLLLEFALLASVLIVVLIIGYIRPHRADVSPYRGEKWIISPTVFRYLFWFGILTTLMMGLFAVYHIYYR